MNILQINTLDNGGGAAAVTQQLKENFERRGITTSLFVKQKSSNGDNTFTVRFPSPFFRLLQKITGKDISAICMNKLRPFLSNDIDFFGTGRLLHTNAFRSADIVQCHNLHGEFFTLSTLSQMASVKPLVWTLHDMWSVTPHCAHTSATTPIEGMFPCDSLADYQGLRWDNTSYLARRKREIYSHTQMNIVVPCEWLKSKIEKSALAKKSITVIHNGVDTETYKPFSRREAREKLHLPLEKKILLFLAHGGVKNTKKGGDVILRLAKTYSKNSNDIVFVIIGGRQNTENGNSIHRVYEEERQNIALYYSAADILVFPSKAEVFPLTVLEAMACGTLPVSFDVGGVKEVIEHHVNGCIVKDGDITNMKKEIDWVLSLPENERRVFSQNAVEKIGAFFTITRTTDAYILLYKKILAEYGHN